MGRILVCRQRSGHVHDRLSNAEKGRAPVFAATDGSEVVYVALTVEPAVVLLDVSMPGMDGYSALKWLKQHPAPGEFR